MLSFFLILFVCEGRMELDEYVSRYGEVVLPNLVDRIDLKKMFQDLMVKQNNKCAITGVNFNLTQFFHPCSPWLKHNSKKTWLPEFELVAWVFRPINRAVDDLIQSYVNVKPKGVYIDFDIEVDVEVDEY